MCRSAISEVLEEIIDTYGIDWLIEELAIVCRTRADADSNFETVAIALDGVKYPTEHNPETCGCAYIGNNMWTCGHIDGETDWEPDDTRTQAGNAYEEVM